MKSTEEGCVLKKQLEDVQAATTNLDARLTQVEHDVGKMRAESQDGFKAINTSLSNLAHDFGERMTNLDKRIIVEKEKWGDTLRWVVKLCAKALVAGALIAMGITAIGKFLG